MPLSLKLPLDKVEKLVAQQPPATVDTTKITSPWLLASEAAAYLKRSAGTLAQMRFHGVGPKYYSDGGKVLYLQSDLDEWVKLSNRRKAGKKGRGKGRGRPQGKAVKHAG